VDLGHSFEPRAVGDGGVAYLVAFPLNARCRAAAVVCCRTELAPSFGKQFEIPSDHAGVCSLLWALPSVAPFLLQTTPVSRVNRNQQERFSLQMRQDLSLEQSF
jgi:hypothetical protein